MRRYIANVPRRHAAWSAIYAPRPFPPFVQRVWQQQLRNYAEQIVKVPEMAESISEGTLKQFTKKVGESFERDEELATIETDKVCILYRAVLWTVAHSTRS